jgi:hypothetical protein
MPVRLTTAERITKQPVRHGNQTLVQRVQADFALADACIS